MNRKSVEWRNQAKAQLRAIDQSTALRLLNALAIYAATGEGDVKRLRDIEPRPSSGSASATTDSVSTSTNTPST